MGKILIGGGTGLVGQALSKKLSEEGYEINILTRNIKKSGPYNLFYWNPLQNEIDLNAFEGVDRIINLSGENISKKRWSKKQREIIEKSRVLSTELLRRSIKDLNLKPIVYISSSAIGYYGTYTSKKIFNENDPAGNDFLAKVCVNWENSVKNIEQDGTDTVILRTGVVFSKFDGAFQKMIQSLKYNSLLVLGKGNQYMPWIHIEDLASLFLYFTEKENLKGIYNAVAPVSTTQKEIIQKLKEISEKKVFITGVPGLFFKLLFGEMSSILLYGSRVSSKKIENSGFKFKYNTLEKALQNLV